MRCHLVIRVQNPAIRAIDIIFHFCYGMLFLRSKESMRREREHMKYSVIQNIFFLLKGIREEHPRLLVLLALESVLSVISPVFGIYIPKIALDLKLQGADSGRIFMVLGTAGLFMTLSMALAGMAREGKYMMYNDMRRWFWIKVEGIMSCGMRRPSIMRDGTVIRLFL